MKRLILSLLVVLFSGIGASPALSETEVGPVYVYEFTARWCTGCRCLKPITEKTIARHKDFVRLIHVDMDDPNMSDLVARSGVQAIPALVVQDRFGRTLKVLVGLQQGLTLDRLLDHYSTTASIAQPQ